ncbi:short chain dehydrogenase/reductase family protein [Metarhizium album ARSEF 1941]|uniref:Short chain dehydrogenase/reductase family protein n=1 Tax=Metarhizium album (strain ARSEF 1941) TaxID=1081103 RepID=A0A0B2WI44_METAS|nr:short chain dehydrogenase/reductase family protein [Metarhizium album ARSEF 1941]KHN95691.1 short chain dehydrogenase/reductase family protein [Metarhizium album ARSEF 1941]
MADEQTRPAATHNSPRTWVLTAALSPLAVRLIRQLLSHGDYVVACLPPQEIDHEQRSAEFRELIAECKSSRKDREGWENRIRGIRCDGKMSSCISAVADAVTVFGRIDILSPKPKKKAVVATVEELSTNRHTQSLARQQFESNFFSQVNFIKAALPQLRKQHTGHIIALTSTCGHLGTPGMSMFSAATWGFEGYCDSLAYEVAPFNIKVTIVQPNLEIQSLTGRLTFAPQIPVYVDAYTAAPNVRDMLSNVLNSDPDTAVPESLEESGVTPSTPGSTSLEPEPGRGVIFDRYARLSPQAADALVNETVHALTAIGGHENPPSRHIVGSEAALVVKEKLKTVTEEMEDFVDSSLAVDIFESELTEEAKKGKRPRDKSPEAGGRSQMSQ